MCDSYHVREDVLQRTYLAAVAQLADNAQGIIDAISEGTELAMQPVNKAAMQEVEQAIIDLQEEALALHRQKQQGLVDGSSFKQKVADCASRMEKLEARQKELQSAETRYAEVRLWLNTFAEHVQSGDIMTDQDGSVMRALVERIIVNDDGIEVCFKCGASVRQPYAK